MKVLILIPAYNEEENIAQLLTTLSGLLPGTRVLVVDDGSSDNTARVAKKNHTIVLSHPFNLGYGAALETGYLYALKNGYDVVAQLDSDLQHDPENLPGMLKFFSENSYDLLIGSRFLSRESYRVPLGRRMVIGMLSLLTLLFTGKWITDPTSGYQILSHRVLKVLAGNLPSDFPDADVLTGLSLQGFKIGETGVLMRERAKGTPQVRGLRALYYLYKLPLSMFLSFLRRGM